MAHLGDKVKDRLTPLEGIVIGRTEYLYGCVHVLVNPGVLKDGVPADSTWIDEDRVEVVQAGAQRRPVSADERHGGPALIK
jgi:hypothetical protein